MSRLRPRIPRTLLNRSRNLRKTITGSDLVERLLFTPSGSNVYSFWQQCAYAPSQTPESRHAQKTASGCKWVLKSIEYQLYSMFDILCAPSYDIRLLFFAGHVFFWQHCRTTAVILPRGRRASDPEISWTSLMEIVVCRAGYDLNSFIWNQDEELAFSPLRLRDCQKLSKTIAERI